MTYIINSTLTKKPIQKDINTIKLFFSYNNKNSYRYFLFY